VFLLQRGVSGGEKEKEKKMLQERPEGPVTEHAGG